MMSDQDVREEATTLASRCACLPGTAFIFERVLVSNTINLGMLVEACTRLPRLGWGIQSLEISSQDLPIQYIPLDKLHNLWPLCPNVTGKSLLLMCIPSP